MAAIVVIAIAAVALVLIVFYNRLVRLRNTVRSSWSDIDVHLKKRFDLVPGLVETVKGYAKHEREVFDRVTQARAGAMQAGGPAEAARQENALKDTLRSLFAVAENYPDLKANESFTAFQKQLQQIEDHIEEARRYYNAVVRDYNSLTETFPSVVVASAFGFKPEEFFRLEAPAEERQPIKPDFSS
jgi:LemA protein